MELTFEELCDFPDHFRKHVTWSAADNLYEMKLVNVSLEGGQVWKKTIKVAIHYDQIWDRSSLFRLDYENLTITRCHGDKCRREITPEGDSIWCESCHGDLDDYLDGISVPFDWLKDPYDIDLTECKAGIDGITKVTSSTKIDKLLERLTEEEGYIQTGMWMTEKRISKLKREIEDEQNKITIDGNKIGDIQRIKSSIETILG